MGSTITEQKAVLEFFAGWQVEQRGHIRQGQPFAIKYDPARLPNIRDAKGPVQVWDIEAFVKFHPSGELSHGSVMRDLRDPPDYGTVYSKIPGEFALAVPPDAARVEIWFRNYSVVSFSEQWDSRYGANYLFPVES